MNLPPCPKCGRHADTWILYSDLYDWICEHGKDGLPMNKLIHRAEKMAKESKEHKNYTKWKNTLNPQ